MSDASQAVGGANTQKNLDYFSTLKNAFSIVRGHRYLWYLGILAGAAGSGYGGGGGGNSNIPGSVGKDTGNKSDFFATAGQWIQQNMLLIAIVALVILIVIFIFMILSNMARAGLVHSVDSLSRNEESSFAKAMKFGWHKFWRVFGMGLLIGFVVLGLIILLVAPAVAVLFVNPLLSIPIILVILPFIFIISIISGIIYEYALRHIVLKDEQAVASIKSGYRLMMKQKKETALIWLMTLGVATVSGIVLVAAIILIGLILFLLGLLLFMLSQVAGIIYVVVAIAAFVVAMLLVGGFISSLISAYWTLCFKQIAK